MSEKLTVSLANFLISQKTGTRRETANGEDADLLQDQTQSGDCLLSHQTEIMKCFLECKMFGVATVKVTCRGRRGIRIFRHLLAVKTYQSLGVWMVSPFQGLPNPACDSGGGGTPNSDPDPTHGRLVGAQPDVLLSCIRAKKHRISCHSKWNTFARKKDRTLSQSWGILIRLPYFSDISSPPPLHSEERGTLKRCTVACFLRQFMDLTFDLRYMTSVCPPLSSRPTV